MSRDIESDNSSRGSEAREARSNLQEAEATLKAFIDLEDKESYIRGLSQSLLTPPTVTEYENMLKDRVKMWKHRLNRI